MARAFDRHIPGGTEIALGALLRQVRVEAGLQRGDLAARLGVRQSVLSKMEAGEERRGEEVQTEEDREEPAEAAAADKQNADKLGACALTPSASRLPTFARV